MMASRKVANLSGGCDKKPQPRRGRDAGGHIEDLAVQGKGERPVRLKGGEEMGARRRPGCRPTTADAGTSNKIAISTAYGGKKRETLVWEKQRFQASCVAR